MQYAVQAFNARPIPRVLLLVSQIQQAWRPIMQSALLAVGLGIAYLVILRMGARCILYVCASTVIVLLLGAGFFLMGYADQQDEIRAGTFDYSAFKIEVPKQWTLETLAALPITVIMCLIDYSDSCITVATHPCFSRLLVKSQDTSLETCPPL
jgi:hypothetical protein